VIVERFEKVHPGKACDGRTARAELLDTEWRLVELGGMPVRLGPGQPTLLLTTADSRASGFAGCNRMMGGYVLEGDALSFSQMASTRMACAEGMDLEGAYLAAIDATTAHKLAGQVLELYAGERLLARFEPGPAE
jgi:heat shock protein HslJ